MRRSTKTPDGRRKGWKCWSVIIGLAKFATKSTLHVHHRYYKKGKDNIWDYPLRAFITLCESCHESETECLPDALKDLEDAVREHFMSCDIEWLACNISGMVLSGTPQLVMGAFAWAFSTPEIQRCLIERYQNRDEARTPQNENQRS